MTRRRTEIFGATVDVLALPEAIDRIVELRREGHGGTVVTPNLDHVVRLREQSEFRATYGKASLVLADGMPLVWVSRLGGTPLPERVTGADLIQPLCRAAAQNGLSLFFFGSRLTTLCKAARTLSDLVPGLEIAGVYAPPFGFQPGSKEDEEVVEMLESSKPDLILVALGSPKQEIWADRYRERFCPAVFLSIGAGLDFIAGDLRRAPTWTRAVGLEWLYRALTEPLRLGPRYLRDLLALPRLLVDHYASLRRSR